MITEEEILEAVKAELKESFGSMTNGNTPYTVLGVVKSALDRMEDSQFKQEWIPVSIKPEKEITKVLAFDDDGDIGLIFADQITWFQDVEDMGVTHYMILPSPPIEK